MLTLIVHAVEKAGYKPGEEITIAIDAASSELYDEEKGVYFFPGESRMKGEKIYRDAREMTEYYEKLVGKFPIVSIEDGLWEDDWEGWKYLTEHLGKKVQLVGDDLFVTNIKRLRCGIQLEVANAILIKVNQIWNPHRKPWSSGDGPACGISRGDLPQIRRDRGFLYRRSGGSLRSRTDQNRCALPFGPECQV